MEKWEEVRDDEGRVYYYNVETQETSWTKPDESASKSRWQVFTTDEGEKYYFNEETGVTTWDPPAELSDTLPEHEVMEDETAEVKENGRERSQIEKELESEPVVSNQLIEPPQFDSFQEAENAFVNMLKTNGVDSTWSFQSVMSKFIKEPIYWVIPDSLHRKKLFEDYLITLFKEEKQNRVQIVESFEENFKNVLQDYQKSGKLKHTTRWLSIKKLLIDDDNPIFNHSILSDEEISQIYYEFREKLKTEHDEKIANEKSGALGELESYLLHVNPSLVAQSEGWEELYSNLTKDSRFQANKHFTVLNKLDILELYQSKIYNKIIDDLKDVIRSEEKQAYRADRKARDAFKELLQKLDINENTKFKDILPLIEDEDSFIDICGRNGSSPIELFWDIVDEKKQAVMLKRDLAENILLDARRSNPEAFNPEDLYASVDNFVKFLLHSKDNRLSTFSINSSEYPSNSNIDHEALSKIYNALKDEHEAKKSARKEKITSDLHIIEHAIANAISQNKDAFKSVTVEVDKDTTMAGMVFDSQDNSLRASLQEGDYSHVIEVLGTYGHLNEVHRLLNEYNQAEFGPKSEYSLSDVCKRVLEELVRLTNHKNSRLMDRKRPFEKEPSPENKRRRGDNGAKNSAKVKSKPVVLNY